jgi:3-hydroxyisobutyrate dehydrogenase-like beta-hydroxyacid dehydrogenase
VVYNRNPERASQLVQAGATLAASPAQAVQPGGVVVTMVANDAALKEVTLGAQGFAPTLGAGGLHISMSTVSPETSRLLAQEHARHGSLFVSAPVFGRPEAAAAKKLWIVQSGDAGAKARAEPVLRALGQGIHDFGEEPGAANVVKLSGNFVILSAVEAMGEALALAEKNGVDREALAAFWGETIFGCPIYQNYSKLLAQRQYEPAGFKLELGLKDVRLVREVAEQATLPMPLVDLLHERLLTSLAKGRGGIDWTGIELVTAEAGGLR